MDNAQKHTPSRYVSVKAQARLHLGFLDMHGGLDRKFGSLGMAISEIETALLAEYADDIEINGPGNERASDYAEQVLSHFGVEGGVKMDISSAIPEHAGLGSGTQLSLAVATAIAHLYDLDTEPEQLAALLHRGARSGIGIGTFKHGGFIVDAGRGPNTIVPPAISHLKVPDHWRFVLIFDDGTEGMNGVPERRAFSTLPPLDEETTGLLCRVTLMQALPAIAEDDSQQFGAAITMIQNIVGDYFSQVQGGRYTSPFLKPILKQLEALGSTGYGQSSWGPTGFALFPNETSAFLALKQLRADWASESRLNFKLCQACNHPAQVSVSKSRPTIRAEDKTTITETISSLGER